MHTLLDVFEKTCAARADRSAAADQSLMLDYKSFRAVAAGLAERIRAGTSRPRVGVLAPTSVAGAVALFAAWYAGKTPVPLNFLLSPQELAKIVRDADLDFVLAIDRFAPLAEGIGLKTLLLSAQTMTPAAPRVPDAGPDDLAVMIYTSGTSGDPKGVMLSFSNLVQNAHACIQYADITPDEVFFSVLPQFHSFGLTAMTVVPLLNGSTVHYQPRFSPVALVNTVQEKQVSIMMAIPSMYGALAMMKSTEPDAFRSVRFAVSGGEPLPARVAELFEQRYGVRIYEGFGMTESSPVVSLNIPTAHRPRSVGRAIPGVSVRAVEPGTSVGLPAGQDGELVISGHGVMLGYHNKPEQTAAAIKNGELYTGDMGHVDADGYVFITGRIKEMMIVGGENVFPFEIESVIGEHPAVAEAAVIGMHDDVRGELPIAFVLLKDGATATDLELREFCKGKLAGYKIPREVRIETDLPRGPTGKILKRALKERIASNK